MEKIAVLRPMPSTSVARVVTVSPDRAAHTSAPRLTTRLTNVRKISTPQMGALFAGHSNALVNDSGLICGVEIFTAPL